MNRRNHFSAKLLESCKLGLAGILVSSSLLGVMATVSPAYAHHSQATYDVDQEITVEGVVTAYEWRNPHVYVYLEQTTESGAAIKWQVEGMPPALMLRQGWSRDTLRKGDTIAVTGNPAKDSDNTALYPKVIRQADRTLFDEEAGMGRLASASVVPESAATGLEGTWTTLLAMDVILKLFPESMDLTDAGSAAAKNFVEQTMHPGIDCVPFPAPTMMVAPDTKQITKGDGVITIRGDFDGAERIIHLGAATHDGATASNQGHSIGHWEGETLVIDTTLFADHALGNAFGVPSGSQKHLLERLRLNADGKGLTYEFELTDPEFLAVPIAGKVQWAYRPELTFAPEACDPENARRFIGNR